MYVKPHPGAKYFILPKIGFWLAQTLSIKHDGVIQNRACDLAGSAEQTRLEAAPGMVAGIVYLFVTFVILSRRRGRGEGGEGGRTDLLNIK